jgi:hypothetical protein
VDRSGRGVRRLPPDASEVDLLLPDLLRHIESNAPRYFPELGGPPVVRLERGRRRRRSDLYLFRITDGRSVRFAVLKLARKVPRAQVTDQFVIQARPHLGPPAPVDELAALQFRAMRLAYRHFGRLRDPRVGAVRALDHLPELNALIMEYVDHPTLAVRLRRHSLPVGGRLPSEMLATAVSNAGVWLREYHSLAGDWKRPELGLGREDFVSSVREVTEYLSTASGDVRLFTGIGDALERLASEELDERLPAGLSHGDYAPRNVFVTSEGTAVGFDALPAWNAATYLDIGRFVISLRSSGVQVVTMGRAHGDSQLDLLESAFLDGYFGGQDPPLRALRLFQIRVLLDRWAALLARSRPTRLRWRMAMLMRQPLFRRQFRGEAIRLLRLLDVRAAALVANDRNA